jgi:hypothetical protein
MNLLRTSAALLVAFLLFTGCEASVSGIDAERPHEAASAEAIAAFLEEVEARGEPVSLTTAPASRSPRRTAATTASKSTFARCAPTRSRVI